MKYGALPDTPATLAALVHARDALGDVAHPDADTHLTLALLLLKLASDAHQARTPTSAQRPFDRLHSLPFCVPAHARFDTLFRQRHVPGNAFRVMDALRVFTLANPRKLGGLFPALQLDDALPADDTQRDQALVQLLERLTLPALDFRAQAAVGNACISDAVEGLLERSGAGRGGAGTAAVPAAAAWLMAALTRPTPHEAVYDPFCRHGAVLLAAWRWMRAESNGAGASTQMRHPMSGQEPDPLLCALARLRLLLHGSDDLQLRSCDALQEPLLEEGRLQRFHVALACPPLHLKWVATQARSDPYLRFLHGTAPRQWAHAALIQHMLATLDPQVGRAAIVVPHGVLFRDGEEARIRAAWLDANRVETVIGLPDRLFGGASVATALLVFRVARSDASVLFVDARTLSTPGKRRARLGMETAAALHRLCTQRSSVPGVAHLAGLDEITANQGNLSIARYVRPAPARMPPDLATLRARRTALEAAFASIQRELNAELDALEREFANLA